jgi:hypothetical protein
MIVLALRPDALPGPQPHQQLARYGALPRAGEPRERRPGGQPPARAIRYKCLDLEP